MTGDVTTRLLPRQPSFSQRIDFLGAHKLQQEVTLDMIP
jgi:hypothetical protein